MDWLRIAVSRIAALFRARRLDADLDAELRAHIELAIEEEMKRGGSRAEARTAALREFGGVTQAKEAFRVQRGVPLLERLGRDVRFTVRQLRKSPGFSLTAIFTLALGLGANTAVFSLMNALLLRPLPVPRAEELALLYSTRKDDPGHDFTFSAPMFRALEKRREIFPEIGAFSSNVFQVRSGSGTVDVPAALVSGQFFQVMQTPPLLGRSLTQQDDQRGGTQGGFAVVISEGFWRTWFNGAPDVVGRRLTIANAPFTIVGVMPRQFIGADPTRRPDIYAPIWAEPITDAPYNGIESGYHSIWLRIIARCGTGLSLERANAALLAVSNLILDETAPEAPGWIEHERKRNFQLSAESGSKGYSYLRSVFFEPLIAVFSLCAAMLLLACLNLASLLMARSAARERELATRAALGATRARLIQQLLVESLLIALLGTLAGMLAAPVASRTLAAFILGNNRSARLDTTLDLRVFAFVTLTAIAVTALIGLVPALRATSKNLNEQIKSGSQAATVRERQRLLPRLLMGLEVALALVLVVGAGLLATSLTRLYRVGLGFDPNHVVDLDFNMTKQALDGDALARWYRAFGDALSREPGVESISLAAVTPMSGSVWSGNLHTPLSGGDRKVFFNAVSPGYFSTLRIPLMSGRDYRWNDDLSSERKIILNRTAARYLFPGRDAIGQHVRDDKNVYEVIAVSGDIHYVSIREDARAEAYFPITQSEEKKPSYTAAVRFHGSPASLASAARLLAAKMAPDIPSPVMTTLSSDLDASLGSERMMAMLAVFFAVCALLVTAIGLYGTLAYATARRTNEIGIRMALGARRPQVVALVFRENAWAGLSGSLLGLIVALLAARALSSFLYGTSARDPWVMAESVALLAVVAALASLIPAIRAASIDPMRALRTE